MQIRSPLKVGKSDFLNAGTPRNARLRTRHPGAEQVMNKHVDAHVFNLLRFTD